MVWRLFCSQHDPLVFMRSLLFYGMKVILQSIWPSGFYAFFTLLLLDKELVTSNANDDETVERISVKAANETDRAFCSYLLVELFVNHNLVYPSVRDTSHLRSRQCLTADGDRCAWNDERTVNKGKHEDVRMTRSTAMSILHTTLVSESQNPENTIKYLFTIAERINHRSPLSRHLPRRRTHSVLSILLILTRTVGRAHSVLSFLLVL